MAVQQNQVSRVKRDSLLAHDCLKKTQLSIDPTSGETHRRHHVTPDGFYRGRRVVTKAGENA